MFRRAAQPGIRVHPVQWGALERKLVPLLRRERVPLPLRPLPENGAGSGRLHQHHDLRRERAVIINNKLIN